MSCPHPCLYSCTHLSTLYALLVEGEANTIARSLHRGQLYVNSLWKSFSRANDIFKLSPCPFPLVHCVYFGRFLRILEESELGNL